MTTRLFGDSLLMYYPMNSRPQELATLTSFSNMVTPFSRTGYRLNSLEAKPLTDTAEGLARFVHNSLQTKRCTQGYPGLTVWRGSGRISANLPYFVLGTRPRSAASGHQSKLTHAIFCSNRKGKCNQVACMQPRLAKSNIIFSRVIANFRSFLPLLMV